MFPAEGAGILRSRDCAAVPGSVRQAMRLWDLRGRWAPSTASTARGATEPSIPIPRVRFQGSFIRNLDILAGGGFTFPQGQGRIAPIWFDLVPRRAPGVERLSLARPSGGSG